MNETYGGVDRFRLTANALPLPVRDRVPGDLILRQANPPAFGFTVDRSIPAVERIDCYASGQGSTRLEALGSRVEVMLAEPFPTGRARITPPTPAPDVGWRS